MLKEQSPMHVVCRRLGKSGKTARKHYLQVTDEHFQEATLADEKIAAKSGAVGAQTAPSDPDLRVVIAAWSSLPEATRWDILGIIRAAGQ
jgi:hypothetical protein